MDQQIIIGVLHRIKMQLIAFGLGSIFVLSLMMMAELACRALDLGRYHTRFKLPTLALERDYPANYFVRNKFGVFQAPEGQYQVKCVRKADQRLIYDARYSIDEFGRRITPIASGAQPDRFAIFLGCSFTYGEGVNDNETMAYHFADKARSFQAYNYAFSGLAPFDILVKARHNNFLKQVPEKNGIVIYTFDDDNVRRTKGALSYLLWKNDAIYMREVRPGEFKRDGTFQKTMPGLVRYYPLLMKSSLFRALGLDIPIFIGKKDFALTARVVEAIYRTMRQWYPEHDFYFMIFPGSDYGRIVASCFREKEIRVVDLTDLYDSRQPQFSLCKEDGHPSALAHRLIGQALADSLSRESGAR